MSAGIVKLPPCNRVQCFRVCGNISLVPEFKWVVDDQQPQQEAVSVIMKNIGLSDGKPEGMSFTLSGNCSPSSTATVVN
jgi:hypothetical protein